MSNTDQNNTSARSKAHEADTDAALGQSTCSTTMQGSNPCWRRINQAKNFRQKFTKDPAEATTLTSQRQDIEYIYIYEQHWPQQQLCKIKRHMKQTHAPPGQTRKAHALKSNAKQQTLPPEGSIKPRTSSRSSPSPAEARCMHWQARLWSLTRTTTLNDQASMKQTHAT